MSKSTLRIEGTWGDNIVINNYIGELALISFSNRYTSTNDFAVLGASGTKLMIMAESDKIITGFTFDRDNSKLTLTARIGGAFIVIMINVPM